MKVMGLIEATNHLPGPILKVGKKMQVSRKGSEVCFVSIPLAEVKLMKDSFLNEVKNRKLISLDKASMERAEIMHMIGVVLLNASKHDCKWLKDNQDKLLSDAVEFDKNSNKTIITEKGKLYLIFVYNGKWILGNEEKDNGPKFIRDVSDGTMD